LPEPDAERDVAGQMGAVPDLVHGIREITAATGWHEDGNLERDRESLGTGGVIRVRRRQDDGAHGPTAPLDAGRRARPGDDVEDRTEGLVRGIAGIDDHDLAAAN